MANRTLAFDIPALIKAMDVSADTKRAYLRITATPEVKRQIGDKLIEKILTRTTKQSVDKYGDKFVPYSKAYKNSLAFKAYGKTNKVNMTLTGEMLSTVDVLSVSGRTVKITFNDDDQFQKASGHIDGANYLPVRDFWGLPLEDAQAAITEAIKATGGEIDVEELVDSGVTFGGSQLSEDL